MICQYVVFWRVYWENFLSIIICIMKKLMYVMGQEFQKQDGNTIALDVKGYGLQSR